MAQGELRMEQLDGFVAYESAHDSTCTTLFSLTNFGTPVDFSEEYTEGDRTYLFTFQRGTILGSATATMVFAKPSASSTNTRLDAPPGCGLRTVTTDLATLEPVQVPFEGPWLVDWSNVTSDGQGNPFNGSNVDRLTLWFVAGGTPSNVEDLIPELDVLATEIYDAEIAGSPVVDLAFLSNPRDGQPFSTFRTNEAGVWLFGLRCSVCMNAELPLVLAVFEPIEPR
jgi:hypothetical protein